MYNLELFLCVGLKIEREDEVAICADGELCLDTK